MNFIKINSIFKKVSSIILIGSCFLAGCAAPLSPEDRISKQRSISIYDVLKYRPGNYRHGIDSYQNGQDGQGNFVAYRSYVGLVTGAYKTRQSEVQDFSDNCSANGGTFDLERSAKNNFNQVMNATSQISWNNLVSMHSFWQQYNISAPGSVLSSYLEAYTNRRAAAGQVAFLFDSVARTENVGVFICTENSTQKVRWRLMRDIFNARKGWSSPTGMYKFPDDYSVYFSETIIVYEKQKYTADKTGFTQLPRNINTVVYPITGLYVVIEQQSGKWNIVSTKSFKSKPGKNNLVVENAPRRKNPQQEILILSDDRHFVIPAYSDSNVDFKASDTDAFRDICHIDKIADKLNYSVCNSSFADQPREISMAIKLLKGGSANGIYNLDLSRTVSFQPDQFFKILREAKVADIPAN